jgi:hypothetical protein
LLTDQDEMSNLYTGPSIDASYQISVSEENIKIQKGNRRRTPSDGKSSHRLWQGEPKSAKETFFYKHSPLFNIAKYFFFLFIFHVNFLLLKKSRLKYISTRI